MPKELPRRRYNTSYKPTGLQNKTRSYRTKAGTVSPGAIGRGNKSTLSRQPVASRRSAISASIKSRGARLTAAHNKKKAATAQEKFVASRSGSSSSTAPSKVKQTPSQNYKKVNKAYTAKKIENPYRAASRNMQKQSIATPVKQTAGTKLKAKITADAKKVDARRTKNRASIKKVGSFFSGLGSKMKAAFLKNKKARDKKMKESHAAFLKREADRKARNKKK